APTIGPDSGPTFDRGVPEGWFRTADAMGLGDQRRRQVTDTLNSVHNAARLLGLFTPEEGEWGLTALARALDLTKQSTLRLLRTLEAEGLVERAPGQTRYR